MVEKSRVHWSVQVTECSIALLKPCQEMYLVHLLSDSYSFPSGGYNLFCIGRCLLHFGYNFFYRVDNSI